MNLPNSWTADVPPDRATTPERLQNASVLVLESISLSSLRAVDLPRGPAGHRSLPGLAVFAALPLGIRGAVSRGTLAHANEHPPWQMYADLVRHLIGKARRLYAGDDLGVELAQTVYALDATTVDLCLRVFPWATFAPPKNRLKSTPALFDGSDPDRDLYQPGCSRDPLARRADFRAERIEL